MTEPRTITPTASPISPAPEPPAETTIEVIDMNLPTALSMVGGQHPAVGFAQWRVQEAYAQLDQAEVLWLPSLQAGFSFHRHDGNYQASDGSIVDVNRNSFQYGLGAGAVGAGTTPRPGLVAQFHLADAIFQPEIARTTAWARGHAANGVMNEQLLNVAVAYLELLEAWQDTRILEDSRGRTRDLSKLTSDFAATGQGLQADADRLETELKLVDSRLVASQERIDVASARLAQQLSIAADRPIAPLDPTVVPIDLIALDIDRASLISTGLMNRPELKESQALVAAACEQYRRQKYAPFVPSVLLGFSTSGFGGGLGNNLDNVDDRYDFDALMTWEVRNLGFGERAARPRRGIPYPAGEVREGPRDGPGRAGDRRSPLSGGPSSATDRSHPAGDRVGPQLVRAQPQPHSRRPGTAPRSAAVGPGSGERPPGISGCRHGLQRGPVPAAVGPGVARHGPAGSGLGRSDPGTTDDAVTGSAPFAQPAPPTTESPPRRFRTGSSVPPAARDLRLQVRLVRRLVAGVAAFQ